MHRTLRAFAAFLAFSVSVLHAQPPGVQAPAKEGVLHDAREIHLADVRQLTHGGENAEAYWSPDGKELIFQSTRPPYECDQIFRMSIDNPDEKILVSTGTGRTTCAYFTYPQGDRVIFSSTHEGGGPECPPRPDYSQGYVWPIYPGYEIYSAKPDGSDLQRLTNDEFYDAEVTVCQVDGSFIYTSMRDGDLELYRTDADGTNTKRLTHTPGYDGGAFFSQDCSQIVWRASRPQGEALADYQRLLKEDMIRPSKLEIWVADADGDNARQITWLDSAAFAPYFHPSGERILFSTNYGDPRGREFDIWAVDVDGTDLERITYTEGFDGFPMFSPDGEMLVFASNRNQGKPGETDVYLARWVEAPPKDVQKTAADRVDAAIHWLADDAREGRGLGSAGLDAAADWLHQQMDDLKLEPFFHEFDAVAKVEPGPSTGLKINGETTDAENFNVASFSSEGEVEGEIVAVGYGVTAEELDWDDYSDVDVDGKIALVRRFVPGDEIFEDADAQRRYGDLRYKAWNAREHGAAGVLIVDLPLPDAEGNIPEEAPLPRLSTDLQGGAGLPVMAVTRAVGASLFEGDGHRAALRTEIVQHRRAARNVVAKVTAGAENKLPGVVVVGAHYDHLGHGEHGSLDPDSEAIHNGADDNASGTAALLEIGRALQDRRDELRRDVWIMAFSAEEWGLLGSTELTRNPPEGLVMDDVVAMLNLDMIGRLRENRLSVLGAESAEEWMEIVDPACAAARIDCAASGDGYGPSDQTPFYAAGAPVLHFFTGTHSDYHKPSDDAHTINSGGVAQIASLVGDVALRTAAREERLTYKESPPPAPQGDARSYGASLGTIPDYAGDDRPGVLLAGTRKDSPADKAGMQRGDLLVELAGHKVGDIYDFMYVLRNAKPKDTVKAVVLRGDEAVELTVTFGVNRRLR